MPVTANNLTLIHIGSGGVVQFFPDVCKTPQPAGPPVPIPYPNVAQSKDTVGAAQSVKVEGNPAMIQGAQFSTSTGDEAGCAGGLVSGIIKGAAELVSYSFDVTAEGKPMGRQTDLMLGNKGGGFNTPPAPEMQPPQPPANPLAADNPEQRLATLTVRVQDSAGNPMKNLRYVLERPDGSKEEGVINGEGKIEIPETVPGIGRLVFPELPDATIEVGG